MRHMRRFYLVILPLKVTQISHAPYKKIFCLWSVLKYILFKQNSVFKTPKEVEQYLLFHQIKV